MRPAAKHITQRRACWTKRSGIAASQTNQPAQIPNPSLQAMVLTARIVQLIASPLSCRKLPSHWWPHDLGVGGRGGGEGTVCMLVLWANPTRCGRRHHHQLSHLSSPVTRSFARLCEVDLAPCMLRKHFEV